MLTNSGYLLMSPSTSSTLSARARQSASFPALSRVFHPPPMPSAHLPRPGQVQTTKQFSSAPDCLMA